MRVRSNVNAKASQIGFDRSSVQPHARWRLLTSLSEKLFGKIGNSNDQGALPCEVIMAITE